MAIKGMTSGDIWVTEGNQDCMVILEEKDSDHYLTIWISRTQAEIILASRREPAENITDIVYIVGLTQIALSDIKSITIHQDNKTFSATMQVENEEGFQDVDLSIGEALASADTMKLPILADESLFDHIKSVLKANGIDWDKS